ncbi:MAG: 3-deoxy-manno-octulosonate cytidylyltransferase [Proteobacteria bacterium]|nr:3-deoxy-manno-octulosonate cytidylyltransferase [Pseudomonadota bacterium]MBU1389686.1 3-deoxy-manno-octulosonate cytidylyltransferase [Pseudomonadota bacterium]MBU1542624.1 3-deoxy-manno-octulosonate cytidylyltransferase [Pseudomonadota bacterium]MBU2479548.1 3-deoxy-manno-octulosonate cytidylyltransferase [Pseudomonadota bacterium]
MTIAIIPSRYGSSRFEGKPLRLIAGKSMIQRVYEQAQKSKAISQTIVATDDERIIKAVKAFGGKAVMTSDDCRSGTDRVAQTAQIMGLGPDEIIVNIQGDQPVFNPLTIDELIAPFAADPDLVMSTLAFKIQDTREITDPKDVKVTFDNNQFALYFSRAQIPYPRDPGTKADFYKHLGFYAYKKSFLDKMVTLPTGTCEQIEKLEQLRVLEFGYKIKVVITPYDSPEIDLPEDIERIESTF